MLCSLIRHAISQSERALYGNFIIIYAYSYSRHKNATGLQPRLTQRCFSNANGIIKNLITGPKGNSGSCFPEILNIEVKGKQNSLLHLPTQNEKKLRRNRLLYTGWFTNLPRYQGARTDHVRVESSWWCFARELVSFDPRHVTRSPPIEKLILVGRYNYVLNDIPLRSLNSKLVPVQYREFINRQCSSLLSNYSTSSFRTS